MNLLHDLILGFNIRGNQLIISEADNEKEIRITLYEDHEPAIQYATIYTEHRLKEIFKERKRHLIK